MIGTISVCILIASTTNHRAVIHAKDNLILDQNGATNVYRCETVQDYAKRRGLKSFGEKDACDSLGFLAEAPDALIKACESKYTDL